MRRAQIIMARNLREQILKRYRTVELFAHENNINKGWLYRVLRKQVDPSFSRVAKMADALSISLEKLYPGKKK